MLVPCGWPRIRLTPCHAAQGGRIENQHGTAVAQIRGARDALDAHERIDDGPHDDLALTDDPVDREPDGCTVLSSDEDVETVAGRRVDTDQTRALDQSQVQALREQIPLARLGTSADIAAAVVFLASDLGGYITGETLNVNGGMSMH